jgi:hypothetical protein
MHKYSTVQISQILKAAMYASLTAANSKLEGRQTFGKDVIFTSTYGEIRQLTQKL